MPALCLLYGIWDLSSFHKSRQVKFWEMEVCQGFGVYVIQKQVRKGVERHEWTVCHFCLRNEREQLLDRRWVLWVGLWFKPLMSLHLWRKMEGLGSILESVLHQIYSMDFFFFTIFLGDTFLIYWVQCATFLEEFTSVFIFHLWFIGITVK